MADPIFNLDFYEMPSNEILRHRREFYSLSRRSDDQSTTWLKRIRNCIRRCDFPAILVEFLLFDRFVCGLNDNGLKSVRSVSKSWTLKQLLEPFLEERTDAGHTEGNLPIDDTRNQIMVKSEQVCEYFQYH